MTTSDWLSQSGVEIKHVSFPSLTSSVEVQTVCDENSKSTGEWLGEDLGSIRHFSYQQNKFKSILPTYIQTLSTVKPVTNVKSNNNTTTDSLNTPY